MSIKKPILDHCELQRQRAADLLQNTEASSAQRCAANRAHDVLAAIDSDLRARSAKAEELIKRSLVTLSTTRKLIACSRMLLEELTEQSYRNGTRCVADIDDPTTESINT